jgi:proprotein convertase subtilisin/kexin type 5
VDKCDDKYLANEVTKECVVCDVSNYCSVCIWKNSSRVNFNPNNSYKIKLNSNLNSKDHLNINVKEGLNHSLSKNSNLNSNVNVPLIPAKSSFMETEFNNLTDSEVERLEKKTLFKRNTFFYTRAEQNNSEIICTDCIPGYLLENGICVPKCSERFYNEPGTNKCFKCEIPNCTNCIKTFNEQLHCDACESGFFLENGKCVKECSQGYGQIGDSCKKCTNDNCGRCSSNMIDCVDCRSDWFYYLNNCYSKCPSETTQYSYKGKMSCVKCPSGCSTCQIDNIDAVTGAFTFIKQSCTCYSPKVNKDGVCVDPECGPDQVLTQIGCQNCTDKNCQTCNSQDLSKCERCKEGFFDFNNECVTKCPSFYYKDNNSCKPCKENCGSCKNSDKCDTCKTNYYLTDSGECVICNAENLSVIDNTYCKPCSKYCKSCLPGSTEKCKTCPSGEFLYKETCVTMCPDGFYSEYLECKECSSTCKKCNNSHTCSECREGLVLINGLCVSDCPEGFYNNNKGKCDQCITNCKVCSSNEQCFECAVGYVFYNGACYKN